MLNDKIMPKLEMESYKLSEKDFPKKPEKLEYAKIPVNDFSKNDYNKASDDFQKISKMEYKIESAEKSPISFNKITSPPNDFAEEKSQVLVLLTTILEKLKRHNFRCQLNPNLKMICIPLA